MSETIRQYPESRAEETWAYEGVQCSVLLTTMGHYCGYARFADKPVKEPGYNGILSYVPVHGGITYAHAGDDGMVYGFDCAHLDDERNPLMRDIDWLKGQCQKMADSIVLAAEYEDRYLMAAGDNTTRAAIIDEFTKKLGGLEVTDNLGAMINVVCGQL